MVPETSPYDWELPSGQFPVRSEYEETEREVVSLSGKPGHGIFVVSRQPGIDPPFLFTAYRI